MFVIFFLTLFYTFGDWFPEERVALINTDVLNNNHVQVNNEPPHQEPLPQKPAVAQKIDTVFINNETRHRQMWTLGLHTHRGAV